MTELIAQIIIGAVTVLAVIFGPIRAIQIADELQKRKAIRDLKLSVLTGLMVGRIDAQGPERLRALALIELAFYDSSDVVGKWRAWHESVTNSGFNDEPGMQIRALKYNDLLMAMARDLGYPNITSNELARFYIPVNLAQAVADRNKMTTEALRVLKNSEKFG